ncbi:Uncharacterized protein Rs2_35268 [Raphanus sativus]|nr:Uncharacterized protein Rs2_35268 [Raphanus sativus]
MGRESILRGLTTDGVSFYGSSTSSNANVLLHSPDLSCLTFSLITADQVPNHLPGDIGDSEPSRKRFFLSKPVHPIHHHPSDNARETTSDSADACSWSSRTTSSIDSVDVLEPVLEWDNNSSRSQRSDLSGCHLLNPPFRNPVCSQSEESECSRGIIDYMYGLDLSSNGLSGVIPSENS